MFDKIPFDKFPKWLQDGPKILKISSILLFIFAVIASVFAVFFVGVTVLATITTLSSVMAIVLVIALIALIAGIALPVLSGIMGLIAVNDHEKAGACVAVGVISLIVGILSLFSSGFTIISVGGMVLPFLYLCGAIQVKKIADAEKADES